MDVTNPSACHAFINLDLLRRILPDPRPRRCSLQGVLNWAINRDKQLSHRPDSVTLVFSPEHEVEDADMFITGPKDKITYDIVPWDQPDEYIYERTKELENCLLLIFADRPPRSVWWKILQARGIHVTFVRPEGVKTDTKSWPVDPHQTIITLKKLTEKTFRPPAEQQDFIYPLKLVQPPSDDLPGPEAAAGSVVSAEDVALMKDLEIGPAAHIDEEVVPQSGVGRAAVIVDVDSLNLMKQAVGYRKLNFQNLFAILVTQIGSKFPLVSRAHFIVSADRMTGPKADQFKHMLRTVGYDVREIDPPGGSATHAAVIDMLYRLPEDMAKIVVVTHHEGEIVELLHQRADQSATEVWIVGFDVWDPFLGDVISPAVKEDPIRFFDLNTVADQFVKELIEERAALGPQMQHELQATFQFADEYDQKAWDATLSRIHSVLGHPAIGQSRLKVEELTVTVFIQTVVGVSLENWQSLLKQAQKFLTEPEVEGTIETTSRIIQRN